jgi:hemoglobin-like flavoprotein
LTYLIPERYFGLEIDSFADQYYLALLALELLQGQPPVEVNVFADLESKREFFDNPRSFFGDLSDEQPAFSFVLTKMLEKDPENRWSKMSELAALFRDLAVGAVPRAVRQCVVEHYMTKLRDNMTFFERFYHHLFESSDEIGRIFSQRGVKMEEQHGKLAAALHFLVLFDPGNMTTLDAQAAKHLEFGIKREHFDLFKVAFMKSLCEAQIEDSYSHDAWCAILGPALEFMKEKAAIQ